MTYCGGRWDSVEEKTQADADDPTQASEVENPVFSLYLPMGSLH